MTGAPFDDLPLTTTDLDRVGHLRSSPTLLGDALVDPTTVVLPVRRGEVAVTGHRLALHSVAAGDRDGLLLHLGRRDGRTLLAALHPTDEDEGGAPRPEDADWADLRAVVLDLPAHEATIAATAVAMAHWHAGAGFCPRCGSPTDPVHGGWSRRCRVDGREQHPRTDPAIIVAVTDDDERLLLARNTGWPEGRASVLAGFVEPGETFAAAVAREVGEEVGVSVRDVQYVADQPWPFPASLMVGCTARAVSTELRYLDGEIAEARWYTREDYRAAVEEGRLLRSGRMSISSRLIEDWLGERLG